MAVIINALRMSKGAVMAAKILLHGFQILLLLVLTMTIFDKGQYDHTVCLLWAVAKAQRNVPASTVGAWAQNGTLPRAAVSASGNIVVEVASNGLLLQAAGQPWVCGVSIWTGVVGIIITLFLLGGTIWFQLREKHKSRIFLWLATTLSILFTVLILFVANAVSGGLYTTCLTLGAGDTDPTALFNGGCGNFPTNLTTVITGAVAAWAAFLIWLFHSIYQFQEYRHSPQRRAAFLAMEAENNPTIPGGDPMVLKEDVEVELATAAAAHPVAHPEVVVEEHKKAQGVGSGHGEKVKHEEKEEEKHEEKKVEKVEVAVAEKK